MKIISPAVLLLALGGCATCREHPTVCKAVVAAAVMGTVIALDHRRPDHAAPTPVPWHPGPILPPGPR